MDRSANMRAIRAKDMQPEVLVRRLVHGLGFRYRLHDSALPGSPDLVFRSRRKVMFVHGCFWHGHGCKRAHTPKSNTGYWEAKLKRNRERDQKHLAAIRALGWHALVVWECETAESELISRIFEFLDS